MHKVQKRTDKTVTIEWRGKKSAVSLDHRKPLFRLSDDTVSWQQSRSLLKINCSENITEISMAPTGSGRRVVKQNKTVSLGIDRNHCGVNVHLKKNILHVLYHLRTIEYWFYTNS
ncbi:hypothetical protein CDAR_17531 [Caerostris darwini]|uniref:Uncharacterized protein n=1 Tax=Caerostris darwini TaxID=1538125 RepID=A0AAV4N8T0_9ARAC|nr:hypothetical protein CDAR_17531 [Caerostris darwini]